MAEQIVRLSSSTSQNNAYNFATTFSPDLKFEGEGWSVAIAQIHIPRSDRLYALRSKFSSNEVIAECRVYYDTSGSGTSHHFIDQEVKADILDGLGTDVTKAEVLQAILASGFNNAYKRIKNDSTITKAYWHDSSGDIMYQRFEWSGDDLVLKWAGDSYGANAYLRLDDKLIDLLYLINVRTNTLSKSLYPRNADNYDIKSQIYLVSGSGNGRQLYLYGNVDWVFVNAKSTPFSPPLGDHLHMDVHGDFVSGGSVLMHVSIPFGGLTLTPAIRDYKPLSDTSFSSLRVWVTAQGQTSQTGTPSSVLGLRSNYILHFKKEKQNLRGDYRREHPTMVF